MKPSADKMAVLMNSFFEGNYHKFARELQVDPSHLYRFMTNGVGGGSKLLGALYKLCMEKGLKFEDYIEI